MPDFFIERDQLAAGAVAVAGIDEAGRGAWAGPLFVGMVLFSPETIRSEQENLHSINDSKQLSASKREKIFDLILDKSHFWSCSSVPPAYIDEFGLTAATRRAISECVSGFRQKIDMLLIDGVNSFGISMPAKCIPRADSLSISVASASIVAKVLRDREMRELSEKYPEYGFDRHKGYGTALHSKNLEKYGPCEIHRLSYKPVREISRS